MTTTRHRYRGRSQRENSSVQKSENLTIAGKLSKIEKEIDGKQENSINGDLDSFILVLVFFLFVCLID